MLLAEKIRLKSINQEENQSFSPLTPTDIRPTPSFTTVVNENYPFNLPVLDLDRYRVGDISSIYYVPDFIDDNDEQFILSCIEKEGNQAGIWQQLRTRRLQCWGGPPPSFVGDESKAVPLPT
eukprot:gene4563-6044_t